MCFILKETKELKYLEYENIQIDWEKYQLEMKSIITEMEMSMDWFNSHQKENNR